MSRVARCHGFTLLEVLVALALTAATFGGALALVQGAIGNQAYLDRRLFATWVAGNIADAYRLEPDKFAADAAQGSEDVLGRRFDYALAVSDVAAAVGAAGDASGAGGVRTVTITVYDSASGATPLAVRTLELRTP